MDTRNSTRMIILFLISYLITTRTTPQRRTKRADSPSVRLPISVQFMNNPQACHKSENLIICKLNSMLMMIRKIIKGDNEAKLDPRGRQTQNAQPTEPQTTNRRGKIKYSQMEMKRRRRRSNGETKTPQTQIIIVNCTF